jgi:hypothetical protein
VSELRANTISDAAGTGPVTLTGQYAAKAWVNFNGDGTVAIRESGNVSSITDNGTGDYTVNLTTALPDANLSVVGSTGEQTNTSDTNRLLVVNIFANNAVRITTFVGTTAAKTNFSAVAVAIFR